MKFSLTLLLIFSIISFTFSSSPVELGKNFEKQGNYYDAITEYERYYFISHDNNILLKIADLYRNINDYKSSNNILNIAYMNIGDPNENFKVQLMEITNYILLNKFSIAEVILERLPDKMKKRYNDIVTLQYVFIYISTNREMQALRLIPQIKKEHIREFSKNIITLHKKKYTPNYIKTLSSIVPGLGQLLVGKIPQGLDAMALNGAVYYLWVSLFLQKDYYDLFVYFMSFKRYFEGQRKHAEQYATERNKIIQKEIISLFKKYLGN